MKIIQIFQPGLISILISLFCFSPVFADDTGFKYPSANSLVNVSSLHLIGYLPENAEQASLVIENKSGKKDYALTNINSAFSQIVELASGVNKIELLVNNSSNDIIEVERVDSLTDTPKSVSKSKYFLHSKEDLVQKCSFCHVKNLAGETTYKYVVQKDTCISSKCHSGFDKAKYLHGPFQNGSCVECHNPHGSKNEYFLLHEKASLCFSCHEDAEGMATEAKYVHGPIKQGDCLGCHDAHKSNMEFHLNADSLPEMCGRCHVQRLLENEVIHEPVESGDCNACHSAHASENKGLLAKEGDALCFMCHEVREEEFKSKYVHAPVKKDCNLCHDPHGSASEYHLKTDKDKSGHYKKTVNATKELCLSCHRKINPQIVDQIENSKYSHGTIIQDGKCTVCHTPHSTNYQKQLVAPLSEICFTCHKKLKETIAKKTFKHGPVATNDCNLCHLVHGGDHLFLLRGNYQDKYTKRFETSNFEICFNCHNPKAITEKDSKETGFRDGTKNLHWLHVAKRKKGRNCKTCHDIHASDQNKHIRDTVPFEGLDVSIKYNMSESGGSCKTTCHSDKSYTRK